MGNPTGITGTLATTLGQYNPLRYRGYVYDTETGLYYLQTRYYNPKTCRFLNADNYPMTGQGFAGNNMFAYCGNNPACFRDDTGDRYCASTSISNESAEDRRSSCSYQKRVIIEKNKSKQKTDANLDPCAQNDIPLTPSQLPNEEETNFDKEEPSFFKGLVKATIPAALSSAAVYAWLGYIGAPVTFGLSVPACAVVGAIAGALGGAVQYTVGYVLDKLLGD